MKFKIKLPLFAVVVAAFTMNTYSQDAVALCQTQVRSQQFETAITTCTEAAKTNAKIGNMGAGLAYAGVFDWANAVKAFTTLIEADPRSIEAFANRGTANYNAGNFKAAYEDFSQAARIEPRLTARLQPQISASREIAELLPVKKATPEIERKSLLASLAANDLLIGRSLKKMNKEPQANIDAIDRQTLEKIDEALKINRHNPHAYSVRGTLYEAQDQNTKALIEYTKAIAMDPASADNRSSRGKLYEKMKNYQFAVADYTKAIELDGKKTMYYNSRADAYEKMGRHDLALKDLAKFIELEPKNSFGYGMRASYHIRNNGMEKALPDLNAMLSIRPGDAFGSSMRCEYYNWKGNFAAALKDCTTAIDKNDFITSDGARLERVLTYIGLKKYDLATADVVFLEKGNTFAKETLLVRRGQILKAQGKKIEAIKAFNDALAIDPKLEAAKKELAAIKP